jgi:hypothetical protein
LAEEGSDVQRDCCEGGGKRERAHARERDRETERARARERERAREGGGERERKRTGTCKRTEEGSDAEKPTPVTYATRSTPASLPTAGVILSSCARELEIGGGRCKKAVGREIFYELLSVFIFIIIILNIL